MYYKKGMREKDPHSFYMIGRCYEQGVGGLNKSVKEAIKNYKIAAEGGHMEAMYDLGDYYMNEANADCDLDDGFNYFEDASRLGYTPAMVRLAICYFEGKGISQDKDYAHDLLHQAVRFGNFDAKEFLKEYFDEEVE